ncbi:MAG: N-acetylglucosamine-6-phosphate deacetylase [Eubacteriaceae bacterium]|nr:N-acetylglucosamine-6-phosphate deacetylase [Eubacteriaceae bacterium]
MASLADLIIKNGLVYSSGGFVRKDLCISGGKIASSVAGNAGTIDAEDGYVCPGFIDIHTHGGAGIDVNSADEEGAEKIRRFFASAGVTAFFATIAADSRENTIRAIRVWRNEMQKTGIGSEILGIHLEGPFLSADHAGAIDAGKLRNPDQELFEEYLEAGEGAVRYMTIAPELPGAISLIEKYSSRLTFAIGHSGADYLTAITANKAGAKSVTHLFNAMAPFHHRGPGILGAASDSNLTCELICDGRHADPSAVRIALKCMGLSRIAAVTDSMQAAGMQDGEYVLAGRAVTVKGPDAMLHDGTRAGSVLTMDRALANLMSFAGLSLEEALPLLTANPAAIAGVRNRKGSLEEGKDADIVILRKDCSVYATITSGITAFPQI